MLNRVVNLVTNSKVKQKFLINLFEVIFCITGRINFTNLGHYGLYNEKYYRRHFSGLIEWLTLNLSMLTIFMTDCKQAVNQLLGDNIIAIDCCFISKSGKKTFGLDWFWSGVANCQKKGLEISCISLVNSFYNTAFHLCCKQTPSKLPKATRIDFYLQQIEQVSKPLLSLSKYICGDGYYAKEKFVKGCTVIGFQIISKLRQDANLRFLFEGQHPKRKGRKKIYDGKVTFTNNDRLDFVKQLNDHIALYEKIVHSVSMHIKIKLVLLRNTKTGGYILLFSTDLDLAAEKIYQYYKSRFQIEFLFRDAKQHAGLSHCQSTRQNKLHNHFNMSLTAISMAKIEMIENSSYQKPQVYSINRYKLKKQRTYQLNLICKLLNIEQKQIENNSGIQNFINHVKIAA